MLSSELSNKILEFVESSITMSQLEEWLVPRLPFFLRIPDSADADIVSAVELGLAEVSSEIRTIEGFRNYLRYVVQGRNVLALYPANLSQRTESGTANQTCVEGYWVNNELHMSIVVA